MGQSRLEGDIFNYVVFMFFTVFKYWRLCQGYGKENYLLAKRNGKYSKTKFASSCSGVSVRMAEDYT